MEAGSGSSPCSVVESGALFVERFVVALDIAQVAGGAHNVVPGAALGLEQPGDV